MSLYLGDDLFPVHPARISANRFKRKRFSDIYFSTLCGMREKLPRTEFGQRLHDARTGAKLTQAQLAAKAGFKSQGSIAELEQKGQGSSRTPQLAAVCGVTPEYLATGQDKPVEAPWPLLGIVSPKEWALLPDGFRDDLLSELEHKISRHRKRVADQATGGGAGKSSISRNGASQQAAG